MSSTKKIQAPNVLLISGSGRNVGKTFVCRQIIKTLSEKQKVIAVKFSPHFHALSDNAKVIEKNNDFIVVDENQQTGKDSSLFLQAGAEKVFFVMSKKEQALEAFYFLQPLLGNGPVVVESGGLFDVMKPGLLLFVTRPNETIHKNKELSYGAVRVENDHKSVPEVLNNIEFINHQFRINNG